jgi:hypothetical protein
MCGEFLVGRNVGDAVHVNARKRAAINPGMVTEGGSVVFMYSSVVRVLGVFITC